MGRESEKRIKRPRAVSRMKQFPYALIISRLFLGFLIVFLAFLKIENFREIIIASLALGFLTDIFDGIIARQLKISTVNLRRIDSIVDQSFWLCGLIASYLIAP